MSTLPPSFLTNTSSTSAQLETAAEAVADIMIPNNGFFPALSLADFVTRYHVTDDYSVGRRAQCIAESIRQINAELNAQSVEWVNDGYLTLAEVPQDELIEPVIVDEAAEATEPDPVLVLVRTYQDAVFSFALKLLAERYRGTDTLSTAAGKADALEGTIDYWNGEYIRHVHYLQGKTGATIEATLI